MAESSSSALNQTLDIIDKCKGPANYREWGRNVRQAFGLYARKMLKLLDGAPRPEETDPGRSGCLGDAKQQHLFHLVLFD